jgi:hypothetical protein
MAEPVKIQIKRIYDPPDANDGFRVLVDRLWPRGLCVVLGATLGWISPSSNAAHYRARTTPECTVYDAAPDHPWNRLHESLFVHVGRDGRTYGQDRLKPLLWLNSQHLLHGATHDRDRA